jgi:Holliday junction resolvase
MSDSHEIHLAETYGLRRTKGSGNQWQNQTDARGHRMDEAVAFAVDGKSTLAKSISVTRADLDKLIEQSAGERPLLAVRFYDDEMLRGAEDWALVREDDLVELLERSRLLSAVQEFVGAESWTAFLREVL